MTNSTTITITLTGTSNSATVAYTYLDVTASASCNLSDTATEEWPKYGQPTESPDPWNFIFQLDQPSINNGWAMTGFRLDTNGAPLTATPGTSNLSGNTSYTVYDPDVPISGGPYNFSFQYTNGSESFWSDPTVRNES